VSEAFGGVPGDDVGVVVEGEHPLARVVGRGEHERERRRQGRLLEPQSPQATELPMRPTRSAPTSVKGTTDSRSSSSSSHPGTKSAIMQQTATSHRRPHVGMRSLLFVLSTRATFRERPRHLCVPLGWYLALALAAIVRPAFVRLVGLDERGRCR
jgi:hypothetical protein